MEIKYNIEDLIEITAKLRSETGCPWDREQTHLSLKKPLLEETYEVLEAIDNVDDDNLKEELGDLLLQVVMHSQIAKEESRFDINGVADGICKKLIRRHPHVFGNETAQNTEEVLKQWDDIKKEEKKQKDITEGLRDIPKAMSALVRAEKVQQRAAKVGFDFENIDQTLEKVNEELEELIQALDTGNNSHINEEFGDLLFSIVNLSRFLSINAEFSLTNAIEKFINRFEGVESLAIKEGKQLQQMTLAEMDKLWEKVK